MTWARAVEGARNGELWPVWWRGENDDVRRRRVDDVRDVVSKTLVGSAR